MSENWDFYPCRVEGEPASIMVNLALGDQAPIDKLPDCVWLHVTMRNPRPDGLSSQEEFERLCAIGDDLDAAVAESNQALQYVGRCTSQGRRDFYAYAESGLVAESQLSSVMTAFAEYDFETGFQSDPEWQLYREFLYPAPESLQLINNRRLVDTLEQRGDELTRPRSVRHFAYFSSPEQAAAFVEAARAASFEMHAEETSQTTTSETAPDNERLTVIVQRVDAVDFVTINNVVFELLDLAKSHNGEYDGWETQVQTPPGEPGTQN